jgi:hypothetical protein
MKKTGAKYGARIYQVKKRMKKCILVKQTILKAESAEYVIDGHRECHVDPTNDIKLAQAVRDALEGKLKSTN